METNIAKTFRAVREKLGLTQAEMAARLGVSRVTLSMYETGAIKSPGGDKLVRLLNIIDSQSLSQVQN